MWQHAREFCVMLGVTYTGCWNPLHIDRSGLPHWKLIVWHVALCIESNDISRYETNCASCTHGFRILQTRVSKAPGILKDSRRELEEMLQKKGLHFSVPDAVDTVGAARHTAPTGTSSTSLQKRPYQKSEEFDLQAWLDNNRRGQYEIMGKKDHRDGTQRQSLKCKRCYGRFTDLGRSDPRGVFSHETSHKHRADPTARAAVAKARAEGRGRCSSRIFWAPQGSLKLQRPGER